MEEVMYKEMTARYQAAADSFVEKVKKDPNVIAVIICGSLAYDQVWEKSDIDMAVVVRDMNMNYESYSLVEDDITINTYIIPRSGFKRYLDSLSGGSMMHSYFSRGKILYSTEDSLYEYLEEFKVMGDSDRAHTVLMIAGELINCHDKSLKWLTVKKDLRYAQYYLLKAAEYMAQMEVCLNGESPSREALLRAMQLNPQLIGPYYTEAMSRHYKEEEIRELIQGIDAYLEKHLDVIQQPIIEYMSDGEIKTMTMIAKHFRSDNHFISGIFEYLADKGVIAKVSHTIRLTPKSKPAVEEIAFIYLM